MRAEWKNFRHLKLIQPEINKNEPLTYWVPSSDREWLWIHPFWGPFAEIL